AGLEAIGAAWQRGESVRWPEPAAHARRVHLPTYPFAGESHGALTLTGVERAEPDGTGGQLTEAAVVELFLTSLGRTELDDAGQSFTGLGGDSLGAIHLAGRIRDTFDVDVPIELFLEPFPLTELISRITRHRDGAGGSVLAGLLDEVEAAG
ncbi:acyl carrier protein, partial [Actinoplanes sp. NPDC026623]|uniref:acyl carrier protein n=1 Tax=Actinoplanes sp. NPDC026623 TaxID=3155610 RepID=UPI0033DCE910